MKRFLLDTHVLIWWLQDSPRLGPRSRELISNSQVYLSAASIWEIAIKMRKGLLPLPETIFDVIVEEEFEKLNITHFHAEQAGKLPAYHNDPFDRMLIAQAQAKGLIFITADEKIPQYGIQVLNPAT
ncbi:type II toxin-antitoxin system VapC family toxin [Pasteurellaceae bacterium USgator11]|nr:type II toxin-antitoxin system VapC family toxin [Pasteurellaceae bacterium USgator41]TNG96399.1 type II toxin-antitoxin system VapC family toxin [Pasteurellaceae bacterium UScroc12]TNG99733.1 type II toxin-antitoxin system VapC family toxin [Pasteurellaceae bacterium UScroc31]TNH03372.1 type II toxin-antitoxin system VapC family toxin [Pasteurellaceae bacterium USgator11]